MNQLPEPILGEITALTITSPDLGQSLAFYKKLGFSEVLRADWPFPWIQVSDGVLLIMLRQEVRPYIALTYYTNKIRAVAAGMEQIKLDKQIFLCPPKLSSVFTSII